MLYRKQKSVSFVNASENLWETLILLVRYFLLQLKTKDHLFILKCCVINYTTDEASIPTGCNCIICMCIYIYLYIYLHTVYIWQEWQLHSFCVCQDSNKATISPLSELVNPFWWMTQRNVNRWTLTNMWLAEVCFAMLPVWKRTEPRRKCNNVTN